MLRKWKQLAGPMHRRTKGCFYVGSHWKCFKGGLECPPCSHGIHNPCPSPSPPSSFHPTSLCSCLIEEKQSFPSSPSPLTQGLREEVAVTVSVISALEGTDAVCGWDGQPPTASTLNNLRRMARTSGAQAEDHPERRASTNRERRKADEWQKQGRAP